MEFISKITPEKKKKRELKFSLYTNGRAEGITGGWASIIIDKNEQKYVLSGKEDNSNNNRMELYSMIEGLNWIYTSIEPKYRKYISVNLYTDNVYCINILREWLSKWKDDLNIRPNSDLLVQLLELKSKIKLEPKWIPRVYNEYSWSVDRITNDRINEP